MNERAADDGRDRIFLTGGTGFFGTALLRHWVALSRQGVQPPKVTVLSRSPEAFLSRHPEFRDLGWLSFRRGDIEDSGSLGQPQGYTHVIHAAADSTRGPQLTPTQRYDQIVNGTRNVLDYAVRCGTRRLLYASSGAVYGPQPDDLDRIPEDWPGAPDALLPGNAYGIGKRVGEHLCALFRDAHGIEPVIARCFAFVGRDLPLDAHFAIGNFLRDAVTGKEITVHGDGTPIRSYLDQSDLAPWLLTLLVRGEPGRAYNVGSDRAITVADLARLVSEVVSPGMPVRILGRPGSGGGLNRYVPDIDRARRELGLQVTVSLESAIAAAAASVRGQVSR